ncbi:MAG: non-ribosomal peptide synthetase [Steroidobacteraceae bacterium]
MTLNASTLPELLHAHRAVPNCLTYLEGENSARRLSYERLQERALGILYHLQKLGAKPGDHLILFLSSNEPFIDAFWAGILGGIVPVPIAPGISDEHRHKLLRVARKLGQPFIYTEQKLLERIGQFAAGSGAQDTFEALRRRAYLVDTLEDVRRAGRPHTVRPQDTAFIQFSSGSTSEPKGVVLTHANLLANIRGASEAARFTPEDISFSWMPLTHDMGLIGFHLIMFANRIHSHLMPTDLFVRRPLLWLQLAAKVRASILCSPNFGYRHYLKVLGERAVTGLDLSAVRLIFNGAEPISVELCDEFLARMQPAQLRRSAMFTVYGLAEASLAVSFPPPEQPYHATAFDRHQLKIGQPVNVVARDAQDALLLPSVGRAIPYCEVRLAGDDDAVLPGEHAGHIQIRGGNVTAGYFQDAATNAASFTRDGWLRTGDLGVFHDGALYITGRHKEILFVNGQNYYPHDLEALIIAGNSAALELGKVVVAGVRPAGAEADQMVAFILHRSDMAEFAPLARNIARCLSEQSGLTLDAVVPVKRIPKTTSGKIQRHLLEQEYLDGAFAAELAELAALNAAAGTLATASGNALERELQEIVETALDGRMVALDESLFDIGASSLKLIAIHERIDARWPGVLDVPDIFDHPTLQQLATLLATRLADRSKS